MWRSKLWSCSVTATFSQKLAKFSIFIIKWSDCVRNSLFYSFVICYFIIQWSVFIFFALTLDINHLSCILDGYANSVPIPSTVIILIIIIYAFDPLAALHDSASCCFTSLLAIIESVFLTPSLNLWTTQIQSDIFVSNKASKISIAV